MIYKIVTAQAPVNIAVIKYWGKDVDHLKIPLNDSISGTLSIDELSATTSAAICSNFLKDKFWLNGVEQVLDDKSQAKKMIDDVRKMVSSSNEEIAKCKLHIVSINNFPTAAGLASSAAGYACLSFVLGNLYGVTDLGELSILARKSSGSACRSLFGGFVQWHKAHDSDTSMGMQIVDAAHWPKMRVVICVVNDDKKDVSSSIGMARSVATSQLLHYRAKNVVPDRIHRMRESIQTRNFDEFAELTMQDSNQFHAVCLDTWPPLFYMNDTSRAIVTLCNLINDFYGAKRVAYTFDAGPNACIYLLEDSVDEFISLVQHFFSALSKDTDVRGRPYNKKSSDQLIKEFESQGFRRHPGVLKYLINTAIGDGPKLTDNHIEFDNLKQQANY